MCVSCREDCMFETIIEEMATGKLNTIYGERAMRIKEKQEELLKEKKEAGEKTAGEKPEEKEEE